MSKMIDRYIERQNLKEELIRECIAFINDDDSEYNKGYRAGLKHVLSLDDKEMDRRLDNLNKQGGKNGR